jgi:predicted NAD-dependent protein-ADP-ribosyltransferase YbiA (DUF1768 family)
MIFYHKVKYEPIMKHRKRDLLINYCKQKTVLKLMVKKTITFYENINNQYTALSAGYSCKITIFGLTFPNIETAFQAAKFANHPEGIPYLFILLASNHPEKTRQLGRQKISGIFGNTTQLNTIDNRKIKDIIQMYKNKGLSRRKDWNNIKDEVAFQLNLQKFETDEKAREVLLSTEDNNLQEINDSLYWGSRGKNKAGIILEKVRSFLRKRNSVNIEVLD